MQIQPYRVNVSDPVLSDLRARLAQTRWPEAIDATGWKAGTDLVYLQSLAYYWRESFDWRAQERAINALPNFRAEVDGVGLHFIHARGRGPKPMPLLLTHGWPDSFLRMMKIIPLLTDPAAHGGDAADSFDIVVPSLPGYGFSGRPEGEPLGAAGMASLLAKLMTDGLDYAHYGAHGGDVGSSVTEAIARDHPAGLAGIHLTDVPYYHLFTDAPQELSEAEQAYLAAGKKWQMAEGAYAMLQSSKPQSLAYGLNDSPAGLAAWIVEKFRSWSDCDGDVERRFSKDELLANITLYWATQTIGSSFMPYIAAQRHPPAKSGRVEVPTAVAIFPKDIVPAPRDYAARFFNLQRWTEMPRGGHFAALEEPELLAADLRAFFRPLRTAKRLVAGS